MLIKSLMLMMLIGVPIAFGLFALAENIIVDIYQSRYLPSIPAFKILIFSLTLFFINYPITSLLNATGHQKENTKNIILVFFVTLALNASLIPRLAHVGAAMSTVLGNALLLALSYRVMNTIVSGVLRQLMPFILKVVVSGGCMFIIVVLAQPVISYLVVPLGALMYMALIVAFKTIPREYWSDVSRRIRSLHAKFIFGEQAIPPIE